eukprot:m.73126 g.73126  ORF g.73126 m.73126 type:complete len:352 (+) comp8412_c1_seq3:99-1154(+)
MASSSFSFLFFFFPPPSLFPLLLSLLLLLLICVSQSTIEAFPIHEEKKIQTLSFIRQPQDDGETRGWIGPTVLNEVDRVRFIRMQKVGSTSLTYFLYQNKFCNHPIEEECGHCMLTFRDSCFQSRNERRSKCAECQHLTLNAIADGFKRQMNLDYSLRNSKVFTFMILRNAIPRFLSHYFYTKAACDKSKRLHPAQVGWLSNRPKEEQDAICEGDMQYYLDHNPSTNMYTKVLLSWGYATRTVSMEDCDRAIDIFNREVDLVLLTEDLDRGVDLFKRTFLSANDTDQEQTKRITHTNPGSIDESHWKFSHDPHWLILIARYNRCDIRLYKEAQKRYAKQIKQAFNEVYTPS